jgi:GNAT superfamily N-acetyltransferase
MAIVEYTTSEEFDRAYPVMHELRTHLDLERYREHLAPMRADGYRLFGLEEGDAIQALAGVAFRTNFYYGRYLWVYDLITTEPFRSRGFGAALLTHLEELARSEACDTIALSSALHRKDAHRFYERQGYEIGGYSIHKPLR